MTATSDIEKLRSLASAAMATLSDMSVDELMEMRVKCFGERALLICSGKGDAADALKALSEAIPAELNAKGNEVSI
jgi:hypothetical protein